MKTFIKTFTVATMVLVFFGCEPEEDTVPLVVNQSFTESELMELVDQSIFADPNGRYRPAVSFEPVIDPINENQQVGNSVLIRFHNGVGMGWKSNQTPKHTATMWWVIFNKPENCDGDCSGADLAKDDVDADLMIATGGIVSNNGVVTFAAHLKEGDITGSYINEFFGLDRVGLVDSENAEIHLVARSHGPKIPGEVDAQTSSFAGGCTMFFDPFTVIPVALGECGDIQFSVYRP